MLTRKEPMKRGEPLKRTEFKPGPGKVGKRRHKGNVDARRIYYKHHAEEESPDWAKCQCCGEPMKRTDCHAHHKQPSGEDFENKVALHEKCHMDFVHDREHTERRKVVAASTVDVLTGGVIEWPEEMKAELEAFRTRIRGSNGNSDQQHSEPA